MDSAAKVSSAVSPDIYEKSGCVERHTDGVKRQYDTPEKLEFYSQVMGDGTDNIHFGKWDGVDLDAPGAYGRASEAMTEYMYGVARSLLPRGGGASDITYVDLGSGTGAAALKLTESHPDISMATCLNLCAEQNALAEKRAEERGLADRVRVVTGTYEDCPFPDGSFDLAFSQDAFVHAFSKVRTYSEAHRITKPGGALIFCDLMCGDGPGVSDEELATFAATNMVNDWLSPDGNVSACEEAGWEDVTFIDLTSDIKISFQLMLRKVDAIVGRGGGGIDGVLLEKYQENLSRRIAQVDRGVFKWGVIHAKKAGD